MRAPRSSQKPPLVDLITTALTNAHLFRVRDPHSTYNRAQSQVSIRSHPDTPLSLASPLSKAFSRRCSRDSKSVASRLFCCVIFSKPAFNYAFTHAIQLCICCGRPRCESRSPECEGRWKRKRGLVRTILTLKVPFIQIIAWSRSLPDLNCSDRSDCPDFFIFIWTRRSEVVRFHF